MPSNFMKYHNSEIDNYKNALSLILHTNEYKKYDLNEKDYKVSSEVLMFSNFSRYFKEELKENFVGEIVVNEIAKQNQDLLKLNVHRCGNVKIFFSEEKQNIFFAEVFVSKNKNLKYKDRPVFGMSKVFMFRTTNEEITLVSIKDLHHN